MLRNHRNIEGGIYLHNCLINKTCEQLLCCYIVHLLYSTVRCQQKFYIEINAVTGKNFCVCPHSNKLNKESALGRSNERSVKGKKVI